ncbi:hypothetical protein FVO59_06510 [Microbacterium esteraromaticum]|uniref:Uncharacterized protein n=1 Tax=Microbacterium esteraromaticum TaxID=57043 RepID=A0A7D7WEL9_9MICO|nr:hypothetical protein [Microbacterium esteraromaticum]QMU96912.1 hypothetical protein FVO59_06510 [Microbacterium esteraromaticum]
MGMNSDTCQLVATVLPLVMVTLVVERRSMRIKLRRRLWFRRGMLFLFSCSFLGLGFTIWGTQVGGLEGFPALAAWILSGASTVGLALLILMSMASTEVDEDEAVQLGLQ